MTRHAWIRWLGVVGMSVSLAGVGLAQPEGTNTTATTRTTQRMMPLRTGTWHGGGGVGFLANTPDGTAFAVNLNADRFLNEHVSIGPLAQLAFTGDLAQYGLSAQAKYWMDLGTDGRTSVVWQGGVGAVRANFQRDDTSWLIPLGVGIEHAVNSGLSVYATFLLNFTDLNTGRGTRADVMPGVTFGVQF